MHAAFFTFLNKRYDHAKYKLTSFLPQTPVRDGKHWAKSNTELDRCAGAMFTFL
jgi:hypothetical protein